MRVFVFILVLANLLFLAWTQGYLGASDDPDALRLQHQLSPEKMKIVSRDEPPASAPEPRAPKAAEEAKPEAGCVQLDELHTAEVGQIEKLVAAVRQGAPEAEFILVSPMCGNPQWEKMRDEAFLDFRSTLGALKGPGIAVADVTSVWLELAKRKPYWDYTGNGLNHPNDFGHRLYAQVILALFAPAKSSSD